MTIRLDPLDGEDRGRIKHHAKTGNMSSLLFTIGATTRMNVDDLFADAGIETPADLVEHYDEHGDFIVVESIGPKASALVEQAIPLIRTALDLPEPETDADRVKRRVERRKQQRAKKREQTLRELTDEPPAKARQVSLFDATGGGE